MHTYFSVHHLGPAWGPKWNKQNGLGISFQIIDIIEMIVIFISKL